MLLKYMAMSVCSAPSEGRADVPRHVIGCRLIKATRVRSALIDVAGDVQQPHPQRILVDAQRAKVERLRLLQPTRAAGSLVIRSSRTEIGQARMTDLQGGCSYRRED